MSQEIDRLRPRTSPARRAKGNAMLVTSAARATRLSFVSGVSLVTLLIAAPLPTQAASTCGNGSAPNAQGECSTIAYNPVNNDDKTGATVVSGGETVTLTGTNTFEPGQTGIAGGGPLSGFNIVSASSPETLSVPVIDAPVLSTGSQNGTASYVDPITGTTRTVNVYVNNQMSAPPVGDQLRTLYEGVGDNQYIDARIGTVDSSGGTLKIDSTGDVTIAVKQSTLYEAKGTGTADSSLVWQSPGTTTIVMNGATMPSDPLPGQNTVTTGSVANWPVTVTLPDGDFTINDFAEYQAFNTKLISLIETGEINQAEYNAYMEQGANLTTTTVTYWATNLVPNASDDVWQEVGTRVVMSADGAHASASIAAGSTLNVTGANGGVLRGTNGAKVTNAGTIISNDGISVYLSGGSTGSNTGVITAKNSATAVNTTDSAFTNAADAIINKSIGGNSNAITAKNSAVVNDGIINLGTSASSANTSASAVDVTGGSFTNSEGATIYLGRGEQTDPSTPAADVALNIGGTLTAINVHSGATVDNAGDIVIGSLTQGASGILVSNASNVDVTNSGAITVKGAAAGTPRLNVGMEVVNSGGDGSIIDNAGTITLEGVNGIGLQVLADGSGKTANATSTGTIVVAGGADPSTGTRNFGVWVEGSDGGAATADLSGTVELTGVGAIGVHARGDAQVTVEDSATVQFSSGTDQIGYFIYGANASIDVQRDNLEVSTERSTLFRIAEGAQFDGSGYTFTASGKDSVALLGTGAGTVVKTSGSTLNLTGEGATGVIVEGGATGIIDAATTIHLDATGTIAGIADGQKHDLSGAAVGDPDATTKLTNAASLNSSHADVTGLIARNSATVENSGTVDFSGSGSTGLLAETKGKVSNTARVTLSGADSFGLVAQTSGEVDNSGDVEMSGATSTGLSAKSKGKVTTTGDVTLTGAGSVGLYGSTGGALVATGSVIDVNGWAMVAEDGASSFTLDGVDATGSDGLLHALNGAATVVKATNSTLYGRALTEAGSTSDVTLTGTRWTMPADSNVTDLLNDGSTIVFTTPASGGFKTLTVDNDYTGANGGTLVMSSTLNDGLVQLTDKMVVHGDTAGSTVLDISNYNGLGAYTPGDGIEVVQVDGTSDGVFTLAHDLYAGAWEYDLFKGGVLNPNDGDWYLRSSLSAAAQTVQPYADSLLKFGQLSIGTLQQRTGNRLWPQESAPSNLITKAPVTKAPVVTNPADVVGSGVWGRVVGLTGSIAASEGTGYDQDMWFMQGGVDGVIYENGNGALVAGIMGTYGNQSVDVAVTPHPVTHLARQGSINTDAYGIGGSLTWLGLDGLYVDGVGQYTWYDSNLSATGFPLLAKGNGGEGYALSLEVGKRYNLSAGWAWVPQAQLVYSSVGFDDFVYFNPTGGAVSVTGGGGDSLLGRMGVRLENLSRTANGQRFQGYGIVNLTYEFLNGTDVTIGASNLVQQDDRLWGEVGLGGTYAFTDTFSLYGEGLYATSLDNVGDSYNWRGILGMRVNW